jgi:glutamate/aspartate transport system ATP-binding protein
MIAIDNVSKWYGRTQVLRDCSARVARGEVVVVCGPSGSGKSTLIKTVNGLEPYQQGTIRVDGIDLKAPDTHLPLLRARIGMVFQDFALFPHLSVRDNLMLAQVERVGMGAFEDRFPRQLSGGQQQRVAIARALAMDPVAMLFDEPTSALDPEMVREVLDVMTGLAQDGMTMMVVTHEMGFARRVADRVLFMDAGAIVEDSPAQAFFDAPRAERARTFLARLVD